MDFLFFLEARPQTLVPFFDDDSPDTLSFPPFSIFLSFFILVGFIGHRDCNLLCYEFAVELGVH